MNSDREPPLSELEAALAPHLRDALRGHTPPGRTSAQRDALERELRTGARALRVRALRVALACALPVALIIGWQAHTASERMSAERERDAMRAAQALQRERWAEEARAAEAARVAEKARRDAAEARAVEEERQPVRASAAAAARAAQAGDTNDRPAVRCPPADQRSAKRGARPAKSCPPAASGHAASGGCDPNDPLCGL